MITRKKKFALVAAATAAVGATLTFGLAGSSPVSADPKQFQNNVLDGFGSDTTQDVMNAFAGFSNGQAFIPLQTGASSNYAQINSWDALPAGQCITVRTGVGSNTRPNGSSQGRRMLSRAFGGGTYGSGCGPAKSVAGNIDFARSSDGPTSGDAGTDLVYVPFARDALSYGYYRPAGGPAVTNLTSAQLSSLFTQGPTTIGGVLIVPCGIQSGSGTGALWLNRIGAGTNDSGTALCNELLAVAPATENRAQESNGPALKLRGDAIQSKLDVRCDGDPAVVAPSPVSCAGAQVILGFSVSSFVARANGVAPTPGTYAGFTYAGLGIGGIDAVQALTGTTAPFNGNSTFYQGAAYGRFVYNVIPNDVVNDAPNTTTDMFVGPTSPLCTSAADTTLNLFGFDPLPDTPGNPSDVECGVTSIKGTYLSGAL